MWLYTKTYGLTDRQSQCDFDFDFEYVQGSYESVVSWRSEARTIFSSEVPE
jgi:hypothetical protein